MSKSFENREGWIWMNRFYIPWKNATSHIVSQGLHYASAVFEGERAYGGKIFKSEEHTDRFFNSAKIIGIRIPFTKEEINQAKNKLINKMNFKDCYVRPLAWRGGEQMGISTKNSNINVAIAVWDDWASYFKIEDRKAGLKLITSPWKRPAPDTAPYEAKASGPYIICTMSKEFAESKGYHDALMLDYRGYVAEGTGANIFFIKDKDIHTPIPDCFLNGITRQAVIKMVRQQGYKITERHILPSEIHKYNEAFLTGTAAEITPIKSIDNVSYNTGDNSTTFKFMGDFSDMVKNSN
jgi:branched-chain amino acid aminotransferase, group I